VGHSASSTTTGPVARCALTVTSPLTGPKPAWVLGFRSVALPVSLERQRNGYPACRWRQGLSIARSVRDGVHGQARNSIDRAVGAVTWAGIELSWRASRQTGDAQRIADAIARRYWIHCATARGSVMPAAAGGRSTMAFLGGLATTPDCSGVKVASAHAKQHIQVSS
jgi:hypothetical protein